MPTRVGGGERTCCSDEAVAGWTFVCVYLDSAAKICLLRLLLLLQLTPAQESIVLTLLRVEWLVSWLASGKNVQSV
jgi:hypothetical protein